MSESCAGCMRFVGGRGVRDAVGRESGMAVELIVTLLCTLNKTEFVTKQRPLKLNFL